MTTDDLRALLDAAGAVIERQKTPPFDQFDGYIYVPPETVAALCRIALAAVDAQQNDEHGTQSLAVLHALHDAGLLG